ADALMWAGFYDHYPGKAYLTPSDKRILLRSPFFFRPDGKPVLGPERFLEKYTYTGGFFGKLAGADAGQWKERNVGSNEAYYFDEVRRDEKVIRLKDAGRGMTVELPINGGTSRFSTDDGTSWHDLYQVRK